MDYFHISTYLWTKSNRSSLRIDISLIVWLVLKRSLASHNSKIEVVILKLDFEKAFEFISWDFLFELRVTRGFG